MIKKILTLIFINCLLIINVNAQDIDLIISPIKYEIQAKPGNNFTKSAKLINKSSRDMIIYTGKSNFITKDNSGSPEFTREDEANINQKGMSKWINIEEDEFKILSGEIKDITFNINIPNDASPGGYYGAVFFKNNNESSGNGNIKINVDYGVLILLNIEGEIIDKSKTGELEIRMAGGKLNLKEKIDKCIGIDLSGSDTDGRCINIPNKLKIEEENIQNSELNNVKENSKLEEDKNDLEDFSIKFDLPFINEGNTHIKPKGEITLIDEDGNQLKGIGKEIIQNEQGAIIGEKIVDYIPINDNGGNVLPNSTRLFESEWLGFPYESYDEYGNKIIKYWSPGEYYSNKNIENKKLIYPWEKIYEKTQIKKIKALVDIGYTNYYGEEIDFNSAKEFEIEYKTKKVGLNPYFFIITLIIIIVVVVIILIYRKIIYKKCINCNKKIKKDMKICPYCYEKQKEKKK